MKLLKPKWVAHEGKPIFSVDIHPDGSRFATGGQGTDSGRVVVWNMSPVRLPEDEANVEVPKVLCELTNHLACVNCVRWSPDGKWLASGGDDSIVMIWQIKYQGRKSSSASTPSSATPTAVSSAVFGGGGSPTSEQWGLVHMLRSHAGDVLDLAWSADLRFLASASVDNSIIVWNATRFPEKHTVVVGHSGMVKGITWDPVGKYLASQSDDRTLRLWRTSDWKEEKQIVEPFKKCGGTTHVLRLSWSPDGKYVVTAHALNNDGPTAHIVERTGWKTGMDFVGHRKAVEVVSFSPHLYRKEGCSGENQGCIAIGSRDRSLSVWLTNLKRPLVVMHDLFTDSILDISWGRDGYELMVCSTDGTTAYFGFSKKELGCTLSTETIDELYMATYGTKRATPLSSSSASSSLVRGAQATLLIEDPELLALQERAAVTHSKEPATTTIFPGGGDKAPLTPLAELGAATVTKQIESRTSDGRRRITPVRLITESSAIVGPPLPFGFSPGNAAKSKAGTPLTQSLSALEKRVENKQEAPTKLDKQDKPCLETPALGTPPLDKKVSPSDPSREMLPPKPISFEPLSSKEASSTPSPADRGASKPAIVIGQKRVAPDPALATPPKAKRTKKATHKEMAASSTPASKQQGSAFTSSTTTHHTSHKHPATQTTIPHLSVPLLEQSLVVQLSSGATPTTLHADNGSDPVCKLTCRRGDSVLWTTILPSSALITTGNQCLSCVAGKDGSLSVFSSSTGRLLSARLSLPAPPHSLSVGGGYHLMAITSSACVFVWDLRATKCIVPGVSFAHLLCNGGSGGGEGGGSLKLRSSWLCRNGLPILVLEGGNGGGGIAHTYSREMGVWVELWNPMEQAEVSSSQFLPPTPGSLSSSDSSTPLDQVQRAVAGTGVGSGGRAALPHLRELQATLHNGSLSLSTLGYLEGQVSRSLFLSSPLEYQHWCRAYVRTLVREGMEGRLREFCGEFSGPTGVGGGGGKLVLGLQKQAFLRDFLGLIGENASLQRLYKELKDTLDSESTL